MIYHPAIIGAAGAILRGGKAFKNGDETATASSYGANQRTS
jgi:hypothetical protein